MGRSSAEDVLWPCRLLCTTSCKLKTLVPSYILSRSSSHSDTTSMPAVHCHKSQPPVQQSSSLLATLRNPSHMPSE